MLAAAKRDVDVMRLVDLRLYARERIAICREQEAKFSPETDAMIEAYTERRTLEAVMRIVDPTWPKTVELYCDQHAYYDGRKPCPACKETP